MVNMSRWTPENESKLLLILLAHYSNPRNGPNWESVAKLMGDEYTAGSVSQHFTKKLAKREPFMEAKKAFGKGGDGASNGLGSAPSTPSKKRKAVDQEDIDVKPKKEEED